MGRVTVIGIGNTLMCDDGVGVRVAEALAETDLGPDVEVVTGSVAGMALVGHFLNSDTVIVVDALDVGDAPGSVYRFEADDVQLASLRSHTSHGLSIPDLIRAARLCGADPQVVVLGVQVGDVSMRPDELSRSVTEALDEAAAVVLEEISLADVAGC